MIEEISIRGLGVIGDARLPLGPGFTALTGETGAGKTMVVTALGLLLGGRADSGVIRSGAAQAVVEGQWLVEADGPVAERVHEAGGDVDPVPGSSQAGLVLSRSISAEGRSRATVGGRTAPVGVLNEIGQQLVVVHGQSDQIRLRSSTAQRGALDRFAGPKLATQLASFQEVFRRWQTAQAELDVLIAERDRRTREADDLRIALAEIEAADPQPGEDDELTERADRLTNLEDLRLAASQAQEFISAQTTDDTGDVLTYLDSSRRLLERASDHDPELAPIAEAVAAATFAVTDISAQISIYLGGLDEEGSQELEIIQERRADLSALVRKYGPTLDDVISFLARGSSRLLELDNDTDRIEALGLQVAADSDRIDLLAEKVSKLRRDAAKKLGTGVTSELAALAMANAVVTVEITDRDEVTLSGKDHVSFLLRPHAGAEPTPLGRGASGGELSRVMLAIEVVIAGNDPVPTFIFDEVDAGVGGAAAIEIGRRLAMLAKTAQVIVVTHLAQVAAFSTNHLRVVKDSAGSVTLSSVQQLGGEERIAEMARLLSGLPDSESGLAHARELLEVARDRVA
ncbi:MAG: recN [Glaciihabitans sp.]|nr:recN [Glaciihabitans sp.]